MLSFHITDHVIFTAIPNYHLTQVTDATHVLLANIFEEFCLLKSARIEDYNRDAMSQRVRSRNWSTQKYPKEKGLSRIRNSKVDGTFQNLEIFDAFCKLVVFEFSYLSIPPNTVIGKVTCMQTKRRLVQRTLKVRSWSVSMMNDLYARRMYKN